MSYNLKTFSPLIVFDFSVLIKSSKIDKPCCKVFKKEISSSLTTLVTKVIWLDNLGK